MYAMALNPRSQCAETGITLFVLRKVGASLSVDRINPNFGYVVGNMRLLALELNRAKQHYDRVPPCAITNLMRRVEQVAGDRISRPA